MDYSRLSMPVGEAIFTQRSIRRFKPDPIPLADVELILEAASKAPNGGNQQVARFLVLNDRAAIREFGALYESASSRPGVTPPGLLEHPRPGQGVRFPEPRLRLGGHR